MTEKSEDQDSQETSGAFVRPFLVTAGRTESSVEGLRLETLVQQTEAEGTSLKFEAAAVWKLCESSLAIAELSARLNLPTATIKVVVGDLIGSGHVTQHKTIGGSNGASVQSEIDLISRLKEGVRRL